MSPPRRSWVGNPKNPKTLQKLWVKENQKPNKNNNPEVNTIDQGDSEEPSDPRLRGGSPRDMVSRGLAQQFVAASVVECEKFSGENVKNTMVIDQENGTSCVENPSSISAFAGVGLPENP